MAGTFAHITLVDSLCNDNPLLKSMNGLSNDMKEALTHFLNFCELGAVSPDCPFLVPLDKNSHGWGNVMHYWKTADFIRRAVPYVFQMDFKKPDTQRCFAWLCGYTAHVVTDLTIHPVIQAKVGDYFDNSKEHRYCELHQDVYIFREVVGVEDITTVQYLSDKEDGIGSCHAETDPKKLLPAVSELWRNCLIPIQLKAVKMDPRANPPDAAPDPDRWFKDYVMVIDKFADEGGHIPFLCRNFLESEALVYPEYNELDPQFIKDLKTPNGGVMDYAQVFELAKTNVKNSWDQLGLAIRNNNPTGFTLQNGDLDTGLADSGGSIYWS